MSTVALSDIQLDALSEIGNIGAGNAGTSLAKMISQVVTLAVPDTRVVSFDQLPLVTTTNLESPMLAAHVAFEGQAHGCVLLLFHAQQAATFFKLLGLPFEGSIFEISDLHKSAVAEIGNIITSAYLQAMGTFTNLQLLPMPPGVAVGMGGAILDTIAAYLGQFAESGIVVQVHIYSTEADLGVELLMIPKADSLHAILSALGLSERPRSCSI